MTYTAADNHKENRPKLAIIIASDSSITEVRKQPKQDERHADPMSDGPRMEVKY
ncbi:conserved hypothetical protein [Ricinus communis]|uniref:Uncharacterized protein n=1 Tax=Ricinus communis TaxID=3988 RepID=B9T4I7_RICCO|nr:conserved hypothetical protein [Ricinus communis]